MDEAIIAAYQQVNLQASVSADDILTNPALRDQVLQLIRESAGPVGEEQILRRLLNLRKRSRLPRSR